MTSHLHKLQEQTQLTAPKVLTDVQITATDLQDSSYTPRHHDQMGVIHRPIGVPEC